MAVFEALAVAGQTFNDCIVAIVDCLVKVGSGVKALVIGARHRHDEISRLLLHYLVRNAPFIKGFKPHPDRHMSYKL